MATSAPARVLCRPLPALCALVRARATSHTVLTALSPSTLASARRLLATQCAVAGALSSPLPSSVAATVARWHNPVHLVHRPRPLSSQHRRFSTAVAGDVASQLHALSSSATDAAAQVAALERLILIARRQERAADAVAAITAVASLLPAADGAVHRAAIQFLIDVPYDNAPEDAVAAAVGAATRELDSGSDGGTHGAHLASLLAWSRPEAALAVVDAVAAWMGRVDPSDVNAIIRGMAIILSLSSVQGHASALVARALPAMTAAHSVASQSGGVQTAMGFFVANLAAQLERSGTASALEPTLPVLVQVCC